MYFDTTDTVFYSFNGFGHLTNHLNYLLHSDKQQKFTNDLSNYNQTFLYINGHIVYIPWIKDLNDRVKLRNIILKCIKPYFNNLAFTRVECRDDNIYSFNKNMVEEMFKIAGEMYIQNFYPFIIQTHVDQEMNYVYFHVLAIANFEGDNNFDLTEDETNFINSIIKQNLKEV